ncbi:hypothetical protein H4Q26_012812 [Puccinia striiformis f. sp. tritici PST-130]|nr:hypothetical protein H4Q26_012812 [Puccinia striiformis f. sp. tritici PST-130]
MDNPLSPMFTPSSSSCDSRSPSQPRSPWTSMMSPTPSRTRFPAMALANLIRHKPSTIRTRPILFLHPTCRTQPTHTPLPQARISTTSCGIQDAPPLPLAEHTMTRNYTRLLGYTNHRSGSARVRHHNP